MHYEFVVRLARLTRIEKAWYQRIFHPSQLQYLVHSLKINMFWAVWNHEVLDANPNASWYF